MKGERTGYLWPDGSPLLTGDRLKVAGIEQPVTIRRVMRRFGYHVFGTYYDGRTSKTVTLARMYQSGFTKAGPKVRAPRRKREKAPARPEGRQCILCLEDYDHAIYGGI